MSATQKPRVFHVNEDVVLVPRNPSTELIGVGTVVRASVLKDGKEKVHVFWPGVGHALHQPEELDLAPTLATLMATWRQPKEHPPMPEEPSLAEMIARLEEMARWLHGAGFRFDQDVAGLFWEAEASLGAVADRLRSQSTGINTGNPRPVDGRHDGPQG